jgi:hypothetical protein
MAKAPKKTQPAADKPAAQIITITEDAVLTLTPVIEAVVNEAPATSERARLLTMGQKKD